MRRKHSRRPAQPELVMITAEYAQSAFGPWHATLTAAGGDLTPRRVRGTDAHEAVHAVLDELAALANEVDAPLATLHQLHGDPAAFAELAYREGFATCVTPVHQVD